MPAGGGPPARTWPRHPHNRTGHRGARHRPRTESEGTAEGKCPHIKAKTPLTRGHAVPKVGLEPDSSPCKHWPPAETCRIRPDPAPVRPGPQPRVRTMCTPPFSCFEAAHRHTLATTEPPRRATSTDTAEPRPSASHREPMHITRPLPSTGDFLLIHGTLDNTGHDRPRRDTRPAQQ